MVEKVSPIVYKQINVLKFNKIKTNEEQLDDQKLFYDNVTRQLIQICSNGIKVFNKSATKIKKEINLQLNKDKIYKIAVDKQIEYMLIFLKQGEDNNILIINLNLGKVIKILSGDLNKLIGFFFIFNTQTLIINPEEDLFFCLIFKDVISYFKIIKKKESLEIIELITEVPYPNLIHKFVYNPLYMILCVQLENELMRFDFYNLNSYQYYSIGFNFTLPDNQSKLVPKLINKNNEKSLFNFFGLFKNNDKKKEEQIINVKEDYKISHFFLESLYNNLYFVYLNYEDKVIQFYQLKSLTKVIYVDNIIFNGNPELTLQFIDNLVLIHNFDKMNTTVVDIKSEKDKILFNKFPISSYNIIQENKKILENLIKVKSTISPPKYEIKLDININKNIQTISMLTYTNTIIYNKDIRFIGSIMVEYKNYNFILYNVYFDPEIYYENSTNKYEALINLTRRKHNKDIIIKGLYELIKSKQKIVFIKEIFKNIVSEIIKNRLKSENNLEISKELKDKSEQLIDKLEQYNKPEILPIPFQYTVIKKKDLINQLDIYFELFNSFEFDNKIDPEYIINLLILFINELRIQNVKMHPSYNKILILYLKKIKFYFKESINFQYFNFPDNIELALFLIYEIGLNDNKYFSEKCKNIAIQHGVDMLYRLKSYEHIFLYLINTKNITEAIIISRIHRLNIENFDEKEIQLIMNLAKNFPEIINNFINND